MANNLWSNLDIPVILGPFGVILDLKFSGWEKGQSRVLVSIEDLAYDQ